MKISVGTDIIEIDRIKDAVSNQKFINRIYTTKEISYCEETLSALWGKICWKGSYL